MSCNKNFNRKVVTLFPTATCNLQCRYCNIDKNPALKEIDKRLEESFKGTYYFDRIKEYFPLPNQLTRVETWGGEPFIHMERVYETIHLLINYYPYFDTMYSSTNFSYPEWTDKFFDLMEQFGKYPYRKFVYYLQLSCDGPEDINDAGRGQGITKSCINNFDKLLKEIPERLPENVILKMTIKPTLDIDTIKQLDTKEKIVDYYRFFEDNFLVKVSKMNTDNVEIYSPIPNLAVPIPATQESGRVYAKHCYLCAEITKEITKYLRFYETIMPYNLASLAELSNPITYNYSDYTCGSGSSVVGFLPDNLVSICNEGFTQIMEEYRKIAAISYKENKDKISITLDDSFGSRKRKLCMTDEEYKVYENHMCSYCADNAKATVANIVSLIMIAAMAGQIEERYLELSWAIPAAKFIRIVNYCVKDNYNVTGSISIPPIGSIRLFLNGALQYLWGELDA